MKIIKILLCTIFSFFVIINLAMSDEKIAFINIDKILNESIVGKNILNELENINKTNIAKINSDQKILSKLDDELNKSKNIISKEEFEKRFVNLRQKIEDFENNKKNLITTFNKKRNDDLNKFLSEITPIIQNYMKNNNINILLEKKNIFIGSSQYEITDDIIDLVNTKKN